MLIERSSVTAIEKFHFWYILIFAQKIFIPFSNVLKHEV